MGDETPNETLSSENEENGQTAAASDASAVATGVDNAGASVNENTTKLLQELMAEFKAHQKDFKEQLKAQQEDFKAQQQDFKEQQQKEFVAQKEEFEARHQAAVKQAHEEAQAAVEKAREEAQVAMEKARKEAQEARAQNERLQNEVKVLMGKLGRKEDETSSDCESEDKIQFMVDTPDAEDERRATTVPDGRSVVTWG
ncbi:Hypothetical Protein FCC1311_117822 [Hondaea fermentalgiana]|uniref:Uncharacterized protein n=1 Tax=Hondaea fermentalgiana TaxID=2315210 RepID=A0A2R5FDD7_9STRA|nr:Hypothetical Protein FCC1311_117822 [Hondaea fermentalgiana]|eukprot:GBG16307.1 Hypothetical Protein FCC1311_117822 [Hondaea fermentalgiana]